MILRHVTFLSLLIFISLSLLGDGAVAQTSDEFAEVQKLKLEGDELEKKGLNSEAAERYKDCLCLLELQNWNPEKKREFLIGASKEPVKPAVSSPLFNSHGSIKSSLFERQILKAVHVRTPDDVSTAFEIIQKAGLSDREDRDLILSLIAEVTNVEATTIEQKRMQIECLLLLVRSLDLYYRDKPVFAKLHQLAMELDASNPKDAEIQSRTLSRVLHAIYETRDADLNEASVMRETILDCIGLMEKNPDKISIDLRSSIDRLIQFAELRSLVPLLERYATMQKKRYSQYPQHYMFDVCNLGWAYMSAGRYADAEKLFTETSSICKGSTYCLQQYEFSELSLAQCFILQKRFVEAEQQSQKLITFLADPGIADVNQYGAIAEGMLGEIDINEKKWKSALVHLKRADERLLLITNSHAAIFEADFVKNHLPSERRVLEELALVYAKLGDKPKAQQSEKLATDMKATAVVRSALSKPQSRVNLVYISSVPDAESAINEYCDAILATLNDKTQLLDSLMSLIDQCKNRGVSKAGLRCVDEALKLDPKIVEKNRVNLLLSKAEFLLMQDEFERSRKELAGLASATDDPAAAWMANSMIARSYLREGKIDVAEARLKQLLSLDGRADGALNEILPGAAEEKKDGGDSTENTRLVLVYAGQAYLDLAEILISSGRYEYAEARLKESLKIGNKLMNSASSGIESLQYSLLAYTEALQGKTSESELNMRAASSCANSVHGLRVARTKIADAGTYEALDNTARARRLSFEALQEFQSILPATDLEVLSCRAKLQKLIPSSHKR